MRLSMSKVASALLLGHYVMCWAPSMIAQDSQALIITAIYLKRTSTTLHEPVIVDMSFENTSGKDVVVSLGYNDEKLSAKVIGPDGHVTQRPPIVLSGFGAASAYYVRAHARALGSISLNEWFTFESSGDYQIEIAIAPVASPKEAFAYRLQNNSATLHLTVLPRDEQLLASKCAELLAKIQDLRVPHAGLAAAKALSQVHDPIAVPFLAEAMTNKSYTGLMIDALARLKTETAVDALIAASKSSDPDTRKLAQSALTALGASDRR